MQGPYMICACGYAYPQNINKLKYVGAGVIFPNLDVLNLKFVLWQQSLTIFYKPECYNYYDKRFEKKMRALEQSCGFSQFVARCRSKI